MTKKETGRRVFGVFLFAALALIISVSLAAAEDPAKFPSKPITMVIPFAAGGATDSAGRGLAETAGKVLGQPIVPENRPGGSGVVAYTAVAKAPNDGYTIGVVSGSVVTVPLQRPVPFKAKEDFTWLINFMDYSFFFTVKTDSRWKTLKDFVEEAKAKPGELSVGFFGTKGLMHQVSEQLALAAGVKFKYVPCQGGSEAFSYLLGGHVDAVMSADAGYGRAGTVRELAVVGDNRVKAMPDVPTFAQAGYNVDCPTWLGLFAPKGVDPQIVKKLEAAFKAGAESPAFLETCDKLMFIPRYMDSATFTKYVMKTFDNQEAILKELGWIQ